MKPSDQSSLASAAPLRDRPEKGRKASKEARRRQLIDATIDSLAKRGYAGTTMADVTEGAGLSRGIVNFHFESKDALLVETLRYLADEYSSHWRHRVAKAGPGARDKLHALVWGDFDRAICTRRKLGAWCAFWGEAKSRPTYLALCGARDIDYNNTLLALCREIIADGYDHDAESVATGLGAMLEGLWLRMLMDPSMGRERTRLLVMNHLAALFPRHFTRMAAADPSAPAPEDPDPLD